ncbi:energy transducer TonB [Cylindrospermopsis curvispora]|uniref:TonB family protein n=1 Tax=Cylindrospermopsis curvispora GIHE-G1 TaxID=2666332 RepID=A0A7H0F0W0_9CYAN|nr:hypothetical protein [Cylindrospermopsis curvispora]QNP29676.1 hypothetical protein IAR63_00570 [Cylindrospermopsis curvispora GIHE-G1]
MSYVSVLKSIPEILGQPTGIAAIASLGIHGAIAFIVPLMPIDSNHNQIARTDTTRAVGLMELGPADQNRLPQSTDSTQIAAQLPQLALQSQIPLGGLSVAGKPLEPPVQPVLPPPLLPPIPTSSSNYNLSVLPQRQSLPRISTTSVDIQASNLRFKDFKDKFSPRPLSAPPFVDNIDAQVRPNQSNVSKQPQVDNQITTEIPSEPLNNPSPTKIDIDSGGGIGQNQPSANSDPQQNGTGSNPSSPLPTAGQLGGPMAVVPDIPTKPQEQMPSLPSSQPEVQTPVSQENDARTQKRQQLIARLESYNKLRQTILKEYPNSKQQSPIRQSVPVKSRDMEGVVFGRLVVDPDGKVLDIKFEDQSVSPQLQSQTREFFNANPPKGEQNISSYPFQLRFNLVNNASENIPKTSSNAENLPQTQGAQQPQSR